MGRPVSFDFTTGGGSPEEFLMGTVHLEPTLMHTIGNTVVLPDAPYPVKLVNGKAVHPNVAVSPAGPEPAWAYKVTIENELTGKAWSEFRGVPTGTTQIAYKELPKFVTTIPPQTTAGMMQNWADTTEANADRSELAADRAEAPTDLMNKNLIEDPASLTAGALSAAIDDQVADTGTETNDAILRMLGGLVATKRPASPGLVTLGDSVTIGNSVPNFGGAGHADAWPTYAAALSGQKMHLIYNAGIGGNTTAQMLARFDTDVTPYAPKLVSIAGGTNDTAQSFAPAITYANIRALVAKVRAIGAEPIICTAPPRVAFAAQTASLNAWLRGYAAAESLRLVDFNAVLSNGGTGWKPGLVNADAIHPTPAGYALMGKEFHEVITPQLASDFNPDLVTPGDEAGNILSNGIFVDAVPDIGLADTWAKYGSLADATWSIETAGDGNWQVVDVTGAGAIGVSQALTLTGYAPGDRCRFAVRAIAPQGGAMSAQINFTGAGNLQAARGITQAVDGIFLMDFTVPAGATGATVILYGTVPAIYKFKQPTWRKLA